jgi:hypothetical protein
VSAFHRKSVLLALLFGRGGRLTARNGGFRRGQGGAGNSFGTGRMPHGVAAAVVWVAGAWRQYSAAARRAWISTTSGCYARSCRGA